ncbi:hypothetical protein HMPREF9296_2518 [Prevotella disiens FB035-09AN]|uniref:Uncharacterized protein n=1 Tax=Prevotella disiens FB035-09AN TaxID=866771 RepID=E1KNY2_9BACT|nr:hypothetical protein HMPREF9296_2518 [Prevotella disiens FB035-09AN]
MQEVFPHAQNGVYKDSDCNPLSELPVLIEVTGDVCHYG